MKCPHCGKEIAEDSIFCEYCGVKVDGQVPQKESMQPQSVVPSTDDMQTRMIDRSQFQNIEKSQQRTAKTSSLKINKYAIICYSCILLLFVGGIVWYHRRSGSLPEEQRVETTAISKSQDIIEVWIPEGTTVISDWGYSNREDVFQVFIPNGVETIGEGAFFLDKGLVDVTIPVSVTSIGKSAFHGCHGLQCIRIPNSVTSIGENAFLGVNTVFYNGHAKGAPWGAKSLNGYINCSLIYRDTTMKEVVGCSSLVEGEISIPRGVTTIGYGAFSECMRLTSIAIPNTVTSFGGHAFSCCKGLTSISIPNSVTSIGPAAFAQCINLTSINIPNSVSRIGADAFYGCRKDLKIIVPYGQRNRFIQMDGLKKCQDKVVEER